jgi:hypothetical protein
MRRFVLSAAIWAWAAAQAPPADVSRLAWMAGSWQFTRGPMQFEEHWLPPAGNALLGIGRTIRQAPVPNNAGAGRMVAFEFLRIEARGADIFYLAQPNGRPPTEFRLTRRDAQSAVFENPQHDHPKIIRYRRDGHQLIAEIEGDEGGRHVKQEFLFNRTAP